KHFQPREWQRRIRYRICARSSRWVIASRPISQARCGAGGHRGCLREAKRRARSSKRPVPPAAVDEESPLGVLRIVQRPTTVGDGGRRNAERLTEFDDVGDGSLV